MCDNEDDFLLENGLNVVDSPKCSSINNNNSNDDTNEPFDDLQSSGQIFSLKTLSTLYGDGEFTKSSDDILVQSDHSQGGVDVIDDTHELIFHQNDNVVIIDKQKSDSLTLNSASSETRLNARTNSIIERELRLQKSLSEECEDLGVDWEPSTSELFPDAFISF